MGGPGCKPKFRPGGPTWPTVGPSLGSLLGPPLLKKTTKIKSIKKNIHFKILFIECIITFENMGKVYITTK